MAYDLTDKELKCLRTIKQLADATGVPIVVVGAMARRLVFDLPHGIRPHRLTQDWDFGVRVPSWDVFSQLRSALLSTKTFQLDAAREHRLIHTATGIKVDLVPFGGLESGGHILWPQSKSEMNVIGFDEAYVNSIEIELEEGLPLKVATAPLQVALKLLAFADRRDETDRDLTDLWHFMRNYMLGGDSSRLWEDPIGTHIDDTFDFTHVSPFLLGYDVACACSPATVERLIQVIALLVDPYSKYVGVLIGHSYSQSEEEVKRQEVSQSFL